MADRSKYAIKARLQGVTYTYVDMTNADMQHAIERAHTGLSLAARSLRSRCGQHPITTAALYQMRGLRRRTPDTPQERAVELGRLSVGITDTLHLLSRMSGCRQDWIERARYALTYAGAHIKKDLNGQKTHSGRQKRKAN